jgi:penicillin amidase
LLFNAWIDQLTRLVFKSKLSPFFDDIYHQKNLREGLINIIGNPESDWCDNAQTPDLESCRNLSKEALRLAEEYLSKRYGDNPSHWKWGNAHVAIGQHRPFSNIPLISKLFELKTPFPGDTFTINVGRMNYNNVREPYSTNLAPGMRVIYDLGDFNRSVFIGMGGQSGWFQSKRYREYMSLWSNSNYLPLSTDYSSVKQGELILRAK